MVGLLRLNPYRYAIMIDPASLQKLTSRCKYITEDDDTVMTELVIVFCMRILYTDWEPERNRNNCTAPIKGQPMQKVYVSLHMEEHRDLLLPACRELKMTSIPEFLRLALYEVTHRINA